MDTYFASGERANEKELAAEIEVVSKNSVLDGLLHSVSGLLAVLNKHRQVVALNDSFMRMLGIDNLEETLVYCRENPEWRLSLQTHKYLQIP